MGPMMKNKPTYNELLNVIRYLSYKSDYESLPITSECKEIIEFAIDHFESQLSDNIKNQLKVK